MNRRLLLVILCGLPAVGSAVEPQWNQFRGGRGDGSSMAEGIPSTWSESQHIAWKTAIWGKGWSSPVVWKDRIWLTTATVDGRRLAVLCLDRKTGSILFDRTIFTPRKPQYSDPFNSYASPSPLV